MTFKVQAQQCATCIYRKDSPLDVKMLEAAITDEYGSITGYRICHHSKDVCCRGFWNRHKNDFTLGRMAQAFDLVLFVCVDTLK